MWTPERQLEACRRYYWLNREKILLQKFSRRDHYQEYKRNYYQKNREYLLLKDRINYRMKKWRLPL